MEERTIEANHKPQAKEKTPRARYKSPVVEMSSKQTPELLVGEKTCPTPKLSSVEKAINPIPESPENGKTSKPKSKLPLTKKTSEIPATGNTDKPLVERKTQKFKRKMNGAKNTKVPTDFVVRFFTKLTSLKDPDVVKVMDLLSNANDVKVHRKFFVSCSSKNAAKKLKAKLQEFNSNHEKFHILPRNKASHSSQTPESKSHMLYAINLPRNTTDKDLQNSFSKAKSVNITQFQKRKKCVRIGHINFTNADDAKEALAVKNRRINGSYVQVTTDRSAAVKRLKTQDVSGLPAKRAKLDMEKETQDEAEDRDADDQDNSEDEESCGSEIGVGDGDDEGGSIDDEEDDLHD